MQFGKNFTWRQILQVPLLIGAVFLGNIYFTTTFASRNAKKLQEDREQLYGRALTTADMIKRIDKEIEKLERQGKKGCSIEKMATQMEERSGPKK